MQSTVSTLPLAAIRAFEAAARLGSIRGAASALGVTPAAVSRHIQGLEGYLGTGLFRRSHNAIRLTPAGRLLLDAATPALDGLAVAVARLRREATEVVVSAPITFSTRWLIPRLGRFRAAHPGLRLRLATHETADAAGSDADVTIRYRRADTGTLPAGAVPLFADISLPAVAASHGGAAWWEHPVLGATLDGWDWSAWCRIVGFDMGRLTVGHRLDIDDAALGATIAGLGAALISVPMALEAFDQGLIRPAGDAAAMGSYDLLVTAPAERWAVARFTAWLTEAAAETHRSMHAMLARHAIGLAGPSAADEPSHSG
ncbi:MAG: LysR family transcriptional regulator [Rhodospirillaceae bacterium]|nr:LysR family transcriptional regulator [Rhodospirillaceae bacterium]